MTKQVYRNAPHLHELEEQIQEMQRHMFLDLLLRTKMQTITKETPSIQYMPLNKTNSAVDIQGET